MSIHDDVFAIISTILARPNLPIENRLRDTFRMLAKWRVEELARELELEPVVRSGIFAGMRYLSTPAEGSWLPKIYGYYELELVPALQGLANRNYAQIINVGCAEGYYAVGLARLLGIPVHAFDISEAAQAMCRELAELNGVSDKVVVRGELTTDDFAGFEGKTFVLSDIEGAERLLLDPVKAPRLLEMDLLVEVHEHAEPGVGSELEGRFAATHDVQFFPTMSQPRPLPPELYGIDNLTQLLALWEWRLEDPGWLFLRTKG